MVYILKDAMVEIAYPATLAGRYIVDSSYPAIDR